MLAAPPAPQSAPAFEPSSAAFPYAFQEQQYQPRPSNVAAMNGEGPYSHVRGAMSSSSNGSRGGGQPYQNMNGGGYQMSNGAMNGMGKGPSGMTEAASSSTITPQSNINSMRRTRRPDTEEIKRVGRMHYQELFSFLKSHLAKGEYCCGIGRQLKRRMLFI